MTGVVDADIRSREIGDIYCEWPAEFTLFMRLKPSY
jgi:hypothetical protein